MSRKSRVQHCEFYIPSLERTCHNPATRDSIEKGEPLCWVHTCLTARRTSQTSQQPKKPQKDKKSQDKQQKDYDVSTAFRNLKEDMLIALQQEEEVKMNRKYEQKR